MAIETERHPHGLALAAGGARGAFQAGALLCLAERGVRFDAVAGSSIGSVNGAFLAQGDGSVGDAQRLCSVWRSLPAAGVLRANPRVLDHAVSLLSGARGPAVAALLIKLAIGKVALLDPRPLARILDKHLDYRRICRSPTRLTIALLAEVNPVFDLIAGPWRAVTYVEAQQLGSRQLRGALLAAVAIPLAFPARAVLSRRHADAGIADPVPVRALYQRGARRIVSVALSDLTPQNRADLPGATLLQVRPPASIGSSLPSIFDFSRATIERLIDLGYREATTALTEARALTDDLVALRRQGLTNQALAESLPDRRQRGRGRSAQHRRRP